MAATKVIKKGLNLYSPALHRTKLVLPENLTSFASKRCIHMTAVNCYRKKKIKVIQPPRLVRLREAGATEEEIDNAIKIRAERRQATADYKAKIAEVAAVFRDELKVQEERKKDIAGEQMKKEAEEKLQEAKNLSIILQGNAELKREREIRNLILQERKEKEEEEKLREQMEEDEKLFEKRRQSVLKAIEESKSFVTRENLDEKIAFALENEVNYNFAITPDGQKLHSTKPPGNFDEHGWKGPSPAAFQAGGMRQGEWDFVFRKNYQTTRVKEQKQEENKPETNS